jgi:hypothetical protein
MQMNTFLTTHCNMSSDRAPANSRKNQSWKASRKQHNIPMINMSLHSTQCNMSSEQALAYSRNIQSWKASIQQHNIPMINQSPSAGQEPVNPVQPREQDFHFRGTGIAEYNTCQS